MQEHIINVQLKIQARDGITRAEIQRDLLKQLTVIQEQPPYRGTDGAQWWTNSDAAVRFTARMTQRCLNCGAHEGEPCRDWCAYKPAGRPMPDRKPAGEEISPIPLDELAELNPGMGPKGLHRLQAMEQLLAEDDLAQGIDPE